MKWCAYPAHCDRHLLPPVPWFGSVFFEDYFDRHDCYVSTPLYVGLYNALGPTHIRTTPTHETQ